MSTSRIISFPRQPAMPPLRRPCLLVRAAQAGQAGWRRERDLPRLLRSDRCPLPGKALARLRSEEEVLNNARLTRSADYSPARHVLLMIALLAEMRAAAAQPGHAATA